jgi:hypothetical protein
MSNWFLTVLAVVLLVHGLIHLMGLASYWPLADVAELPYKTSFLGGQWDVGETGTRIISLLWLLAGIGFAAATYGLVMKKPWFLPLLIGATLLSLLLTILDWEVAYRGAIINVLLLALLLLLPRLVSLPP